MTLPFMIRFLLIAFTPLLFGLGGCNRSKAQPSRTQKTAVPVVVGEVIRKDMPVIVRAIGRVTASATVSIKPQLTGTISKVHFTDGEPVRKGDPLFSIDTRPFEVALDQAKATLAEAQAKADNATNQAQRYATLDKSGSVSKEQLSDIDGLQSIIDSEL
ncbi:MAG: biotin/lipoyl-binding protein, partial [Verrucomicrobiota bacterium]